jgi:hypothetical protein
VIYVSDKQTAGRFAETLPEVNKQFWFKCARTSFSVHFVRKSSGRRPLKSASRCCQSHGLLSELLSKNLNWPMGIERRRGDERSAATLEIMAHWRRRQLSHRQIFRRCPRLSLIGRLWRSASCANQGPFRCSVIDPVTSPLAVESGCTIRALYKARTGRR